MSLVVWLGSGAPIDHSNALLGPPPSSQLLQVHVGVQNVEEHGSVAPELIENVTHGLGCGLPTAIVELPCILLPSLTMPCSLCVCNGTGMQRFPCPQALAR